MRVLNFSSPACRGYVTHVAVKGGGGAMEEYAYKLEN